MDSEIINLLAHYILMKGGKDSWDAHEHINEGTWSAELAKDKAKAILDKLIEEIGD